MDYLPMWLMIPFFLVAGFTLFMVYCVHVWRTEAFKLREENRKLKEAHARNSENKTS